MCQKRNGRGGRPWHVGLLGSVLPWAPLAGLALLGSPLRLGPCGSGPSPQGAGLSRSRNGLFFGPLLECRACYSRENRITGGVTFLWHLARWPTGKEAATSVKAMLD